MIRISRRRLMAGASVIVGAFTLIGAPSQAAAQTACTYDAGTFACDDGLIETPPAVGTYTSQYAGAPDYGTLNFLGGGDIDFALTSGELSAQHLGYAVYGYSWSGAISFDSGGVISNSVGTGLALTGTSVSAQTGTIEAAEGGVHIHATAGGSILTAGSTTVHGYSARAVQTTSTGADNVINTGTIEATGERSWGLRNVTASQGVACGTNTVNVTGDISAGYVGIGILACGDTLAHVQASNTVSVTHADGVALFHSAPGTATTTIDGTVAHPSASGRALSIDGLASVTTITGTGQMVGTFTSYTTGSDQFSIDAGGAWSTAALNDFGVGVDQVANAGTISVSGNTSFAGLENFSNSGTINMASGAVGDTLLLSGNYVGSGSASVHIDATDTSADQLIIGGQATGSTSLFVNTSMLIPDPVLVVDTNGADSGAFVLGNSSATPLIDLQLTQNGDDFYLTAVPSETAQQSMQIARVSQRLWQQSADDLFGQSALKRHTGGKSRKTAFSFWSRTYRGNNEGAYLGGNLAGQHGGVQAGLDLFVANNLLVGLTGGYDGRPTSRATGFGEFQSKASNFGVYAQYSSANGFYAGLLAKVDRTNVRFTHGAFAGADGDPNSKTVGAEAEAGLRTTILGFGIDASAALAHVRSQIGDFTVDGMGFDMGNAKSLSGRLGVRGEFGGSLGFFADAKVYHEFANDSAVTFETGAERYSIEGGGRSTWARFEAGFGGGANQGPMLSAWANLGDTNGVGLKAGLRL